MTRWISVKIKLPNVNERVLVYNKSGWIEISKICWDRLLNKNDWDDGYEITHWAYLPDNPKETHDKDDYHKHNKVSE